MPSVTGFNSKVLREGDAEPLLRPGADRIYNMRFCPWAERTLLYAAAKDIPVEVVNIDLKNKPSWYFSKHPKGQVPCFEKGGKTVIESLIVPEYLDGIYPETAILPKDPYERAQQRIITDQLGSLCLFELRAAAISKDQEQKEKAIKNVEGALDGAEKLLTGEYYGGSTPGYADWMSFPFFERLFLAFTRMIPHPSVDISSFPSPTRWPKLTVWWGKISVHPAVKAVTVPTEVHLEYLNHFFTGTPDYDCGL